MTVDASGGVALFDSVAQHLAVPYILTVRSIEVDDGRWIREAAHPELPDMVGRGATPEEAIDDLRKSLITYVREAIRSGVTIPEPRPPLEERLAGLESQLGEAE